MLQTHLDGKCIYTFYALQTGAWYTVNSPLQNTPSLNQELAYHPIADQENEQLRQLTHLLGYLSQNSPFYKDLFQRTGIIPEAVTSFASFRALPFTTKSDMQQRNWDFLCVPQSELREYTATSGTMGNAVTIALTEHDLQRLAYNEQQSFRTAGGTPEDVFQLILTLDRQFMAGMAYYNGIRNLGGISVRSGAGLPAMQWEIAARYQSTVAVTVPSFLLSLGHWAESHGFQTADCSFRQAVCIGEPLRNADFSLNALGKSLQATWPHLDLRSTYAATELQTAFTECEARQGGHVQPDLCLLEVLREDGSPAADGEPGEVVVTTLGVTGMPVLRYRTGDVAALYTGPCTCGRNSPRLGPVIGRLGQMIKYKGTTLYPNAIYEILNEQPCIDHYVIEVYTGEFGTEELKLHVCSKEAPADCERVLKPVLQARLRVLPELCYHSKEEILAMQFPEESRKIVRFLDRRIKK